MTDQDSKQARINEILVILTAFPAEEMRAALKQHNLAKREARVFNGWRVWPGPDMPEPPTEWRKIGLITYYRESPPSPAQSSKPAPVRPRARVAPPTPVKSVRGKTDTSLRENPGVTCPFCGGETYLEPLCPAGKEGRAGMSGRVLCGDNSDHVFYLQGAN